MATTAEIEAHGLSHIGNVREDNQDALRSWALAEAEPSGYLYAVADGMGGYEHGGIASAVALEALVDAVSGRQNGDVAGALRKGVQDANLRIFQQAQRLRGRMGTTLTAAYVDGATLHIVHVGDSRAYLIRNGEARCLTNDHTGVGEMVRARVLSPDKVRKHMQRSVLNRCLGMDLFVQPDITRLQLTSGDVIVLCSDGLWSVVEDDEIAALADPRTTAETICQRLIDCALGNDSDDNITAWAICARKVPEEAIPEKRRVWPLPSLFRGHMAV